MDSPELLVAIQVLQDRVNSIGRDQERLREVNKYLEQRVGRLEGRLAEQPSASGAQASQWAKGNSGCLHEPNNQAKQVLPDSFQQAEKDGKKEEKKEEEEAQVAERDMAELEYHFGLTLWEGVAFVGLPELRVGSSVALGASMALNVFVQGYICYALLQEESFAGQGRFDKLRAPMLQWRLSSAHRDSDVDSRDMSLARRVCEGDESLSLAMNQADLLSEINDYLSLEPEDLERRGMGSGALLCIICVFLFTVVVLRELRGVVASVCAILSVPRSGNNTQLQGGTISCLSAGRLACILFATLVRASVASALLFAGVNWLSSTTSIEDLVLNAAALGFVMDLDEALFETTVPASVFTFVHNLKPLKYRRPRWSADAMLALAVIASVLICASVFLITPNVEDMMVVKDILCGGDQNIATVKNAAGYVVSKPTLIGEPPDTLGLEETAVRELTTRKVREASDVQFSDRVPVESLFMQYRDHTIRELAKNTYPECRDRSSEDILQLTHLATAARFEAGIHAGVSVKVRDWHCKEYMNACQTSELIRLLCPVSCGCNDPKSGLVASDATRGCPTKCTDARRQLLSNAPCKDMMANVTPGWKQYWTKWRELAMNWNDLSALRLAEYTDFVNRKIAQGCENVELDLLMSLDFCNPNEATFIANGFNSVMSFCPATCCSRFPHEDCPKACPPANASRVR